MRKIVSLLLLLVVILVTACTSDYDHSGQDKPFLGSVPNPESTVILHKQEIDEGTLYFYKDQTGFRHAIISKRGDFRLNSENVPLNPETGMNWTINGDPDFPIIILSGVISNKKIQEITIKQNGVEHTAGIVKTDKGTRFWFVIFDRVDLDKYVAKKPYTVEGLSSHNGKVLWNEEIFVKNAYKWGTD
jgi:hypothetical protein